MPKSWVLGAALAASIGWPFVVAADATIPSEYDKLIQQRGAVATLGDGSFGESIDLSTGGLEIVQTDADLPGNNALPVRVGRRFRAAQNEQVVGHFGAWDLDIPHLHGDFYKNPAGDAWIVESMSSPDRAKRCSRFDAPPSISRLGGDWAPDEYWHGSFFYLPGAGEQELLAKPATAHVPASGGPYPAVTKSGAAVRCLASLDPTSEATSSGEGFEVLAPDGTVYRMDHMVRREIDGLYKLDPEPIFGVAAAARRDQGVVQRAPVGYPLPRVEVLVYPTQVTDRFGNTVTYTWDSGNPMRLLHITASDGRQIDLTYATPTDSYQVASVSDGTHVWNYNANGVTLPAPDGGAWSWDLDDLRHVRPGATGPNCDVAPTTSSGNVATGTITAPSGATVTYTVTETLFGRSWVPRTCLGPYPGDIAIEPYYFETMALTERKVTGPGLPPGGLAWTYAYSPAAYCWSGAPSPTPTGAVLCTSGSQVTRSTIVTDPDGDKIRYTFGTRYQQDEGLLLDVDSGWNGNSAPRTVHYTYADSTAAPYAAYNGYNIRNRGDQDIANRYHPQREVITTQQGKTFAWSVAAGCGGAPYCFDSYARPTKVVRAGMSGAYSRTETTAYADNTAAWILGQVASVTCNAASPASTACDGDDVVAATTFDSTYAVPLTQSAFGKLQQGFGYDTASTVGSGQRGTLHTVTDGSGNATTYASWNRGTPQSVAFADGESRSAVVNGNGWITSTTDEYGSTTIYGYDTMGRLASVTYPTGDSTTWNGTSRSFVAVAATEYGLPAGHWRLTESTGNGTRITYFDALWRPVLVREYDAADQSATERFTRMAYDGSGRVTFASYPSTSSAAATGTWTEYDALGRVTSVAQDTELSPSLQATTTSYGSNFTTTVTDPRGHATTMSYMAYDQPGSDWPVNIVASENQTTVIVRDPYGKPLTITRQETTP